MNPHGAFKRRLAAAPSERTLGAAPAVEIPLSVVRPSTEGGVDGELDDAIALVGRDDRCAPGRRWSMCDGSWSTPTVPGAAERARRRDVGRTRRRRRRSTGVPPSEHGRHPVRVGSRLPLPLQPHVRPRLLVERLPALARLGRGALVELPLEVRELGLELQVAVPPLGGERCRPRARPARRSRARGRGRSRRTCSARTAP